MKNNRRPRTGIRIAIGCLVSFSMMACAPKPLWVKPGETQSAFATDRYDCLQNSQAQGSRGFANAYFAGTSSGQYTNDQLFSACMNAKGWTLESGKVLKQTAESDQALVDSMKQSTDQTCNTEAFKPLFERSPCRVQDISFSQLADSSTITEELKPIFAAERDGMDKSAKVTISALRSHTDPRDRAFADALESEVSVADAYAMDLYNGKITWGEYNKDRRANVDELTAKRKAIYGN